MIPVIRPPGGAGGAGGAGSTGDYASGNVGDGMTYVPQCPMQQDNPVGTVNVANAQITDADIENNNVNVTLSGPVSTTANLTVTAVGVTNTVSVTQNNVGPGSYTLSFFRPSMPTDTYSSVQAVWSVASATRSLTRKWIVLGTIRHSQYNTVYENACSAGTQTAYVYDGGCNWQTVSMLSRFVTAAEGNGTGVPQDTSLGVLKFDDGRCNANRPAGSTTSNSFLKVFSITGQCNTTLLGGDSVATQPGPNDPGSKFNCGDNMQLVNSGNVNAFLKHVADRCPNKTPGCADGHVDNYNSTHACSANAVGDLPGSPLWTVDDQ